MKKTLGIGNALVDILISLDNDVILEQLNLPKGSMQLVDKIRSDEVLSVLKEKKRTIAAGGSAANTIHGLAKLGAPTGYIGVIGEDEFGGHFVKDMINAGVEPHMIHSRNETGRAVALISPDQERTFATYLGAAIELSASHLLSGDQHGGPGVFSKYDILHLEGYLVLNHELVRKAVSQAKKNGLLVSLDLSSYNVVEANLDFLREIIHDYVDIVFANEEEAKAFTGREPVEAVEEISRHCHIAIVKTGRTGSLVRSEKKTHEVGIIPVRPQWV